MILRRKPKPKMGLRESSVVRCPGHLKWIRGCECELARLPGMNCQGRTHAHHVQSYRAIEGGMGMKVGDDKTVALCAIHHAEVHDKGQPAFERAHNTDLEIIALQNWHSSPHRWKYEEAARLRGISRAPTPSPRTPT